MPEFVNEQPMYENRPIPTDEQAERFLLGGILRDPDVMGSVVTVIVDDNFFFFERHRLIWHAMTQLYRMGTGIDVLTLSAELEQEGVIQKCGGREYIFDLMDAVASSANVEWNVQHLRSKYVLRQLIKASDDTIKKSLDASFSPDEILQDAKVKAEAQLGSLNAERDRLTAQVEGLKKTVATYRSSFEALLASQKDALSQIDNL